MKAVLLLVFCFVALSLAQEETIRLTIDDFIGFTTVNIIIENDANFPIVRTSTFTASDDNYDGSLLGGERTLILNVETGNLGRSFNSIVDSGSWEFSTPSDQESSGDCTLQIDGQDGDSDLDVGGLGGVDLTEGGLSFAFVISLGTDVDTGYIFDVYSPNGNRCTREVSIPGRPQQPEEDFLIRFDAFTGNCDFENVGALEVNVFSESQVDSVASFFGTFGFIPQTPSNTPTPTRTRSPQPLPSQSQTPTPTGTRTRTPEPSETRTPSSTPSVTPSPSFIPEPECVCDCPSFRCGLVYAVPGDDDDTVDDDIHDDDDIIYRPVYYGPVDDDFNGIDGDDDEHELISRERGLTFDHNDDDDDTSSASVFTLSVAVIAIIVSLI